MIIYCKDHEIKHLIEKIELIETNFWLQYKMRSEENRKLLVKEFDEVYKKIYELIEGKQEEFDI